MRSSTHAAYRQDCARVPQYAATTPRYAIDPQFLDERYEALDEDEASELAARLLDAANESEFDHLLAAT